MPELCLIYADEDKDCALALVTLLRQYWDVWWADDKINQGNWRTMTSKAIMDSKGVIALLSKASSQKPIFTDEAEYAQKHNKKIFPFAIEPSEMPLGMQGLSRTDAFGWLGEKNHPGYKKLIQKISADISDSGLRRMKSLNLNNKSITLPNFVFSLSSFETQISPDEGLQLITKIAQPKATLLSAYDLWEKRKNRNVTKLSQELLKSESVFFLDCGNYEAFRKDDKKGPKNSGGWERKKFIEVANIFTPDIAFSFDETNPSGRIPDMFKKIMTMFSKDRKEISDKVQISPIVHVPKGSKNRSEIASKLIAKVAKELDPILIAIPERELGDGLLERMNTVADIRKHLNDLGSYYPLHLLGTGNPLSIVALAAAGADSFDGLEWCRTAGDWETGLLYHFQQCDIFFERYQGRISNTSIKNLIENKDVPYALKTVCYNIEFFNGWIEELQSMLHAGNGFQRWVSRINSNVGIRLSEISGRD